LFAEWLDTHTLETDADFLAWEAAGRLFDGID
jgi:hypothetical protein